MLKAFITLDQSSEISFHQFSVQCSTRAELVRE